MIRRSGRIDNLPLWRVGDRHKDPVTGFIPVGLAVETGLFWLLRDAMQAAMAPADGGAWAARVNDPPPPEALREALERTGHWGAFDAAHPTHPCWQVRPKTWTGSAEKEPILALLPDTATGEAHKNGADVFASPGDGAVLLPCAVALLVWANTVFPTGGGGYYNPSFGDSALKYMLRADTLWRSLWLNVLPADSPGMDAADWPAPCNERTWPWLHEKLRGMDLGKAEKGEEIGVAEADVHPAAPQMPRRYLLGGITEAACALTGVHGPCADGLHRWPHGLAYRFDPKLDARRCWSVAMRGKKEPDTERVELDVPLKTAATMRFDDWLEGTLPSDENRQKKSPISPAPILRVLSLERQKLRLGRRDGGTALGGRASALSVTAIGRVASGKAAGGFETRSLPYYADLSDEALIDLALEVREAVEIAVQAGDALKAQVESALKRELDGRGAPGKQAAAAKDAHRARLEETVVRYHADLAAVLDGEDEAEERDERQALLDRLRRQACTTALDIFDDLLPVADDPLRGPSRAKARAELLKRLPWCKSVQQKREAA